MPWQVPITVDGLEYPVTFNTENEPTQQDYDEAIQQILQQRQTTSELPTEPTATPEKETPGYLSQLGSALGLGYRQMKSGVGATFNALTGDTADVATEMAEMAKLQREQQAAQTPEDIQFMRSLEEAEKGYEEAKGPLETIGALAQYPAAVIAEPGAAFKTAIQSAPNALISGATSLAGYGLGGLLGGAAGIETGPGAILTGLAGATAGGALSNTLMEAGPSIFDVLNERTQGAASNMTADEIAAYLQENPDIIDEGLKTGAIRGSVIGAVEALGVKGAGRLLTMPERAAARAVQKELISAGVDVASKEAVDKALLNPTLRAATKAAAETAKNQFSSAGNIARLTGGAAIETGAAGAGELAAQAAAGQDISTKEAFMEMLGDAAISLPISATTKAVEGAKYMLNPALIDDLGKASAEKLALAGDGKSAEEQEKFNDTIQEILGPPTEPTIQPEQAAEEAEPEVTPSPTMEQAAAPAVEEPTLTPEPELYAPAQVPSEESVYEEPQDRIESREAEEAILGDSLLRPAAGEEEVASNLETGAPKLDAKNDYFPQNLASRAWRIAAGMQWDNSIGDWIHPDFKGRSRSIVEAEIAESNPPKKSDVQNIFNTLAQSYGRGDLLEKQPKPKEQAPSFIQVGRFVKVGYRVPVYKNGEVVGGKTNKIVGQITRIMPDGNVEVRLNQGGFKVLPSSEIEDAPTHVGNKPTTPKGTPTLATEGTPTSRDVGTERDSTKPEQMTREEYSASNTATLNKVAALRDEMFKKQRQDYEAERTKLQKKRSAALKRISRLNLNGSTEEIDPNTDSASKRIIEGLQKDIKKIDETLFTLIPPIQTKVFDEAAKELGYDKNETHRGVVHDALVARKPVNAAAADAYGYTNLPEGYVKQGDLYVFQPGATGEPVQAAPSAAQVVKATAPGPFLTYSEWRDRYGEKNVTANPRPNKMGVVNVDRSLKIAAGKNAKINERNSAAYRDYVAEWESSGGNLSQLEGQNDLGEDVLEATASWVARERGRDAAVKILEESGKYEKNPDGRFTRKQLPQTATVATQTETAAPSAKGAAVASAERQPVEGSIPTVGKVSPETEISSRENLGPKAAAAKKKQAAADEAAKKRQEKQDNATKSSLNSVVGPQKEDAIQGTVTKVDVETAREALTNSGEIPNAYLTNVYESLEAFLADKANARLFPSAYARLQTEKNIEGLYENGQTLIFAKQIQVSNLDRNLATMLGLTPEQAAARRVIAHENGHKAISLFTMAEKRELRGYLMRAYSDEQIAKLVETYDEYADWRTNLESRFEALEELLMRDFEKMEKIPTGGVWDDIVQFLKRVWRRLTGQKGEPTLKNLKDVARLMRNAMKRPAVPLGSFTLKDGGKVKLSFLGEKAIENLPTPTSIIDIRKLNAEYLAAVEQGDSGNDNLNQLLFDASPDERQAVVDSWIKRNPWTADKIQWMVKEMAKARGYDIEAYHGSSAENDFTVFDAEKILNEGAGVGFYFALDKRLAQEYANKYPKGKVFHVFLKQSTPLKTDVEYPSTPSNNLEAFNNTVEAISKSGQLSFFERQALKESLSQQGRAAPNLLSDPSYFQTGLRAFFDSKEFQNFNSRSKAYLLTLYDILAGKMGKQWSLDTIGLLTRMDGLQFTDPGVFTVLRPNQIKSADPVTIDNAGNVIPLLQRFQPTSPDIRFSRPQFASDTDAATSAGNEAARSTIYSERDMDVREAIRRAYEAMPKDTSVAVPIGELFAKTEELMPGVTQDEFSNVLQDLFEDNGAVLQEGEQIIPEQEVEIQAFEKDNPFNELIRKSTEKSPSLGEINGVSKKFVQRVLRPASNFATNNGIRIDDNAPLQVRAMPDGSIIIGYSLSQERFDELQKMAPQAASQYTKDSVIEELIHLSDLIGLRNQWIKSGKKISFDQFVLGEQSNLAFSLIQKADSLNDLEAESLRRILASSLSLYNNNPEIANLSLNELLDLAAQYPYVLPELVRSLIQLKKTGQLTETAFRKIANVLREWQEIVLQWISDGYASAKEGVFGEMLSERIKNAENNLAQFSDTSEINVTTPEGRRAGFVVVMPRAAKASKIPIDEIKEASKPFKEDLIEASKGREEKAAFKGNVMRGNVVPDHNVNATELYKKAANDLLDSLLKNHDILDVAESVQDPDLQAELGMQIGGVVQPEDILNVRQYLGALLQRRLTVAISSEKNPKRLRQLEMARRSINAYSDGASGGGTALNNAKQVQNDPELKGDFFFSQATREKAQKAKDKLDAITGGTEKITDIITGAEQKAAEETTQAEVEAQESAVEDDQDAALIREGEETLDNESKNLWEKAKMLIMRLAMYARADKSDVKTGSKASLTAEQRDELNAILRMPKAERDKARAKDEAELKAVLRKLIGEESEAKTSEQKKTRQKRVKMIDVVRKYSESGKSIDLADQQTALKGMLREMNKARPADSVPFERAMPWRKILSSNPKDVAEYRQRIFEAISDLPSFQNLTDEQKERLADLYAEAWENRKQAILDRMLRDEIKKARDRDEISEDVEKKLQQSRNKILEIVNLGGFNNDDLVKVLGERYGISTSFTEEQKERIQKLADQLQDEDMNTAKRNKLAMEFAVELAGAMDVPVSEIISNWWTSSVLFGPQTIFSIGAAFLNGGYSIATIGTRRMLAKLVKGDIQGAIEESILMLKGFARYLGAFKQSGRRAWSYLWTGDVGLLGTGSTDILSEINNFDQLQRFQRHKLLAEQLAKDPRMVRRYVGVYLRFVSRLLTALDAFNVMVTKAGTASLALRMSGMSTDKIIEAEKMLNLKAYKDQVIRDYFDNKAPKTQAEKALVDSYAEAEMYRAINKLGGKMENADYLASESAMTMHPTGFGGVVYDAITGFFAQRQSNADEYLEKMKKDWISNKDLKAVTFLALAYLRQFAAYNAAGLTGSKFVRYASNKFNQGLSFIPFAGLLRQIEAKDDRIKGKDAFRETIYRNQIVSFVMLMVGYSVIKAIQDEPDDEERGNFWNGGWANLTPDQKKQMLAKGQKEYTMGFKFNGRWYVFNYQNWPLNQILSAIGSMSDQIRFSPEKWDEKSALSKGVAGMVSGVKSTLEIPALSGLQELVGNRLASKDPTEKDLDRLSRVASGWVGGFVPRILKDIDFYTQPELRKYEGLWEKTASHIPIYRRYVGEEYYDILGQQIKRNVIPGSREFMMGPTEPEYKILGALNARNIFLTPANAEYRMVGKGRNRRRLTQEEADAYSLETGRGYRDMLLRYGQRALQMPTERARAFLQDKADEVRDRALKRAYRR